MAATKGDYSHALLYAKLSLLEATLGGGVFSKNHQRLLVSSPHHLAVYRMRDPLPYSKIATVIMAARSRVGSLYSVDEAMKVIQKGYTGPASARQFCSRLVAQSYAEAGVDLVSRPDFCSPHDLTISPLLEVVENAVCPASPEVLAIAASVDINKRNQRATMRWMKAARRIASRENFAINTQSDVLPFVLAHPQHDAEITAKVRGTTYLEALEHDRTANPFRYDLAKFIAASTRGGSVDEEIFSSELAKEEPLIDTYSRNLAAYRGASDSGLMYVRDHVALYQALLEMIKERLGIILGALAALGMSGTRHERQALQMLRTVQAALSQA